MASAKVTLIVSPRERFSAALDSLDDIYRNTAAPFELVYVDAGSPRRIARGLRRHAQRHGFRLLRSEKFLAPNEARNAGLALAATDYVVFIDNDIMVRAGWLDALLACAVETGAWAVCPTVCWGLAGSGRSVFERVHFAGGALAIEERDGARRFIEDNPHWDRPLAEAAPALRRRRSGLLEFHCVLVKREVFDRLGLLDEQLLSTREHVDFSMAIGEAGGAIWHEPAAQVSYALAPSYAWSDLPYYLLRWSEAWNRATLSHLNRKWNLGDDYAGFTERWLRPHRRAPLRKMRAWCGTVFGDAAAERVFERIETAIARRGMRRRDAA